VSRDRPGGGQPVAAPAAVESAVVLTHTHPEQTEAALVRALQIARAAGASLHAPEDEMGKHRGSASSLEPLAALEYEPDLCLVLGGDGTILKGLRDYARTEVPVFGINFGTVGFFAAIERDELDEGLERAFARDFDVLRMPGLEASADARPLALNDVSLIRPQHSRIAELSYSLGGEEVGHVRCDGLVAATPAGSTGYNLANQGPILAWGVKGFVVSFIAPHTLTARPLVVAPDDVLSVRNAAGREQVEVVIDGEPVGELASGAEMEIRFRDGVGRLAQLPGANFYRRIRDRFGRLAH
jgi:NAD+ kinase